MSRVPPLSVVRCLARQHITVTVPTHKHARTLSQAAASMTALGVLQLCATLTRYVKYGDSCDVYQPARRCRVPTASPRRSSPTHPQRGAQHLPALRHHPGDQADQDHGRPLAPPLRRHLGQRAALVRVFGRTGRREVPGRVLTGLLRTTQDRLRHLHRGVPPHIDHEPRRLPERLLLPLHLPPVRPA